MAEIWIVEDDPAIGKLIEMTVKKAGHATRRIFPVREICRSGPQRRISGRFSII
ncbi:MAG: hypothetical protein J6E44_01835 [Lachnospiraceae bacterium]|nr:hypothetical protein [Lachnospiraceae bacterium]